MGQNTKFILSVLLCALILSFAVPSFAEQEDTPGVAEEGIYQVGIRDMTFTDENRDNRMLKTFIWYPAQVSEDAPGPLSPDTSAAPYPLIIYSHGYHGMPLESEDLYINQLVSQGYVVVAVDHAEGIGTFASLLIDRPLDILFLLNQLTYSTDEALVGLIDTNNVGITGVSFGGYTAIATGGARIDLSNFIDWCSIDTHMKDFISCGLAEDEGDMTAYHAQVQPLSEDGLWVAMTDKRIHAIVAIMPCFGHLFGEEGLAAATVPTFLIGGTVDTLCPFDIDAAYFYEHLGSSDRYLVTLDKRGHEGFSPEGDLIRQYATAFFGYYLQGKTDYAQYITPDTASAFRDVMLEAQLGNS